MPDRNVLGIIALGDHYKPIGKVTALSDVTTPDDTIEYGGVYGHDDIVNTTDAIGAHFEIEETYEGSPSHAHLPDRHADTMDKFWHRAGWLVFLLIFQSTASFVLRGFDNLLKAHPTVVYFLPMLIGAGGGAGSQSTVLVIRNMALGSECSARALVFKQLMTGMALGLILLAFSFVGVLLFGSTTAEGFAVCIATLSIVIVSVIIGTLLPIMFQMFGIDPAHAGAAIQAAMDVVGVLVTCVICWLVLRHVPSAQGP
eukprot:GHVO01017445.1.p1 GENE.GHVO01017445.1~~GHVO01017445.1.p1  ORF type:complete len:256 (+),score=23.10 GHVO01017445.1:83-850(+)